MTGAICLQGGVELTRRCEPMDRDVLDLRPGAVAVLAGAARVGSDHAGAISRARHHYEGLGATVVVPVPDPRVDREAALDVLGRDDLSLVVLPGGSPALLLEALAGGIGERLVALHRDGVTLSGASAGAMVLAETVGGPGAGAPGLGLVPGVVVPHWSPGSERRWEVDADVALWGLPECGGALLHAGEVSAVGEPAAALRRGGRWTDLPRDAPTPLARLLPSDAAAPGASPVD